MLGFNACRKDKTISLFLIFLNVTMAFRSHDGVTSHLQREESILQMNALFFKAEKSQKKSFRQVTDIECGGRIMTGYPVFGY